MIKRKSTFALLGLPLPSPLPLSSLSPSLPSPSPLPLSSLSSSLPLPLSSLSPSLPSPSALPLSSLSPSLPLPLSSILSSLLSLSLSLILSSLLFLYISFPVNAFAEDRNIYVGDIITLRISANEFSIEDITEKFKDFDITEIRDERGEYLVSLRTFETGEYNILLGDKEIIINVQSTLDDIQRDDIFDGDTGVKEPGIIYHWRIPLYITAGIFVLSCGLIVIKFLKAKKTKALNPFQTFLRQSGSLLAEKEYYFVDLTFYFKKYLESLYKFRIIGKTSSEIINELKAIRELGGMLLEIGEWLTECDRIKFTGVKVTIEEKHELYKKLVIIAEKINAQNNVLNNAQNNALNNAQNEVKAEL